MSTSAAVPTRNENVAACAVPTDLPRRELIGACMPTRQPALTPRSTASPRLMAPGSHSLRLQPCPARADVHGQRRLELPPAAHPAARPLPRPLPPLRRAFEPPLALRLGRSA